MCDPVTYAVMSVASAAVTYEQQRKHSKAMKQRNNAIHAAAVRAYDRDMQYLAERREQELDIYAQKEFDLKQDAKKKKATQIVSSGESGVAGFSVQDVINEIDFQEGSVMTRNLITEKNKMASLAADETKLYANMESRINNLTPVANPSFLGTALEVGMDLGSTIDFGKTPGSPSSWQFR